MKDLSVYIRTNESRTTLYIGVTNNNLEGRLWRHQNREGSQDGRNESGNGHKDERIQPW